MYNSALGSLLNVFFDFDERIYFHLSEPRNNDDIRNFVNHRKMRK